MSLQQIVQPRSSANGFGRRRNERDFGPKADKLQSGKTNSGRSPNAGKEGSFESPSRERLVYLTTCLIGHHVEVQVLDGSIYSGIFHATNAEKDFGVILKMAYLIKDGSRGPKSTSDFISKLPSKTLIIPANELVQVIAKGVPVTHDVLTTEILREKQLELMTDSCISQSRHTEMQRELEKWVPDDDDPVCPELENIFDGSWNRGWDQFEVNETLFGVRSTFNEELYTTRLEKGPQMRELEREALRIAREIEGEDTSDLHLAEERGLQLNENIEIDEETRFSSVVRRVDDSVYDDTEDILLDYHNDETFGGVSSSLIGNLVKDSSSGRTDDGSQFPDRSFFMEGSHISQSSTSGEFDQSGFGFPSGQPSVDHPSKNALALDENRVGFKHTEDVEKKELVEEDHMSKPDDAWSSSRLKKEGSDKAGLSPSATAYAPSHGTSNSYEKESSSHGPPQVGVSSKAQGTTQSSNALARPSSSASSTSEVGGAASASCGRRGLSPSSSMGSLSSERSTLNPHAKEFKLNPNAKSFKPSHSPLRPTSPVSDGSFYYPPNMASVPHMHGMPVGVGMGPTYPVHQPVIFNPQAAQTPQAYFPPGGPQMMFGHPRQYVYMPTYPAEMPYKGREF